MQADADAGGGTPRVRPRAAWLLVPLFLLAAALVATAVLWPRGPELVPYVSPPLDASGARLHVLVPRGWAASLDPPTAPAPGFTRRAITFMPRPWLPRAAWQWPVFLDDTASIMTVRCILGPPQAPTRDDLQMSVNARDSRGRPFIWGADGLWQSEDRTCYVQFDYYRRNEAALHRTAPAIYRSLRVEQ